MVPFALPTGAIASTAFNLAVSFLRSGEGDVALALRVEKMAHPDKTRMFAAFDSAWDVATPGGEPRPT